MAAEAQGVAVGGDQLALVAHGAQGLVARGFQARGDVVGLHLRTQGAQVGHELLQLGQQRVAGEVAVDLAHVGEAGHAARNAVEDAAGCLAHRLGATLARLDQGLAARGERVHHGFALVRHVGDEDLVLGEAALQLLELREQAGQRLVALLGCVGEFERVVHRLAKQLELRAELGRGLGGAQALAAAAGLGAQAVDVGVEAGDAVQDGGAHHRVAAGQAAHLLGQQVQPGGLFIQRLQQLAQRGRGVGLGQGGRGLHQRLLVAVESVFVGQERHGLVAHLQLLRLQRLVHRLDGGEVGVAQLLERLQPPAALSQPPQCLHEVFGAAPQRTGDVGQQAVLLAFGLLQGARGFAADAVDLLELGQGLARAFDDGLQLGAEALRLGLAEPEVGVAHAGALADQVFVGGACGHLLAHRARDAHEVGHAAHQLGVAHLGEKAGTTRQRGGVLFAGERRLPQLHGVHARGLFVVGQEDQHAPVGKARVAVRHDGRGQGLVDQVVAEQRVVATARLVEHIEHFLAVRRAQHALETQAAAELRGQIKALVFARLQVHAARKNDAVVFGQLHAGDTDGVDALHLLRAGVEDKVARLGLAVRLDPQQDQQTQPRPGHLGVHQRLVLVFHRLAVDAQPGFGVVLDLDREVAAQGLDEDGVLHVDVRVLAAHVVLARGDCPLEVVGRRQRHVALAAVVHVAHRAAGLDAPAEHAQVVQLLADLEGRKQLVLRDAQLQQRGLLVVGVQLAEVGHETRVVQEAAGQWHRFELVGAVVFGQTVERKHVAHRRLFFQADEDVVAEQQHVADAHQIARDAVVFGARAGAQQQALLGAAKGAQARFVERLGLVLQRVALGLQALFQQLVAATVGHQAFDGVGAGFPTRRRGILSGHVGLSVVPGVTSRCGSV